MDTVNFDLENFKRSFGQFGQREVRTFNLTNVEWRDSGNAESANLNVTGFASVYDSPSLDLGGFTEVIARGAFTNVLKRNPSVVLLREHNPIYTLASTKNNSLEIQEQEEGLRYWATCAPTTYASDLRILMESGIVSEASFSFVIAEEGDSWEVRTADDGEKQVVRTITEIGELADCSICVQGAYPQASSEIAGSVRSYIHAYAEEHVPVEPGKNLALLRARARAHSRQFNQE